MKIALVYTPNPLLLDDKIDPPFGLITIGTLLQNAGYEVRLVNMAADEDIPLDADLYGFSVFTANYDATKNIVSELKRNVDVPIIAGGPHASALPCRTLGDDYDCVVVGECEGNVVKIVEDVLQGRTGIIQGKPVDNLDGLPYWDYGLVDISCYHRVIDGNIAFSYMPSRGCPYKCLFCWTFNNSIKVRFHSVDRIITELKNNNAHYVRFFDDNFGMNRRHLFSLCDALGENDIKYRCTPRMSDLDSDVCKVLSDSGCLMICSGVESGSDVMLRRMQKKQTREQIRESAINVKEAGMLLRVGIVIGFPGETWQTITESVEFLKTLPIDEFNPYIFVPFPGTLPYSNPEAFGITWLSDKWSDYHILSGMCEPHIAYETKDLSVKTLNDMWEYVCSELKKSMEISLQNKMFR